MKPLGVLLVEDSDDDAELTLLELRRAGFSPTCTRVTTAADYRRHLQERPWDVILSDYALPAFSGPAALEILRGMSLDVPFIMLSGTISEEIAVSAMKAGAHDFFSKARLTRLGAAVERELREVQRRREHRLTLQQTEGQLAQAQAEREKLVEGLREALKVRDEFLIIASHELRTPLTALQFQLQGALRLLAKEAPDPLKLTGKLTKANDQTDRLARLIDGLLDVSRLSLGALTLSLEEFALEDAVQSVVERLESHAAAARCDLAFMAPAASIVGVWDRLRVEQIVTNLVSNAIKYGNQRPVTVALEPGPERVAIAVSDHGIGIRPEDRERIFGRFERAVPLSHYGGFGLGLYITRQIVDAHGGQIDFTSVINEGTVFKVVLPLKTRIPSAPDQS